MSVAKKSPVKKLKYKANEFVVYPAHGVGKIVDIEEQEIAGARLELYVIDFEKIPGVSSGWVMNHVRLDKATAIREIEAAGFVFVGEERMLRENYFLKFVRR